MTCYPDFLNVIYHGQSSSECKWSWSGCDHSCTDRVWKQKQILLSDHISRNCSVLHITNTKKVLQCGLYKYTMICVYWATIVKVFLHVTPYCEICTCLWKCNVIVYLSLIRMQLFLLHSILSDLRTNLIFHNNYFNLIQFDCIHNQFLI